MRSLAYSKIGFPPLNFHLHLAARRIAPEERKTKTQDKFVKHKIILSLFIGIFSTLALPRSDTVSDKRSQSQPDFLKPPVRIQLVRL
jgi:hypothetical protein